MKRVLTAAILIPLVLLLVFKAPPWLMALVLALIAWLCLREYFAIVEGHGIQPFKKLTTAVVLLPLLLPVLSLVWQPADHRDFFAAGMLLLLVFILFSPLLLVGLGLRRASLREALPAAASSAFAVLYIGLALLVLWFLWLSEPGPLFVSYVLLVVWTGDIFAYFVGKNLGRHKLAPRISPGKSWEGAAASLVASLIVGVPLLHWMHALHPVLAGHGLMPGGDFVPAYTLGFAVIATVVTNIAGQLGDLIESAMKRGADLKDSGAILPGHGGMLDRVDALLTAAPAAALVLLLRDLVDRLLS